MGGRQGTEGEGWPIFEFAAFLAATLRVPIAQLGLVAEGPVGFVDDNRLEEMLDVQDGGSPSISGIVVIMALVTVGKGLGSSSRPRRGVGLSCVRAA